VVTEVLAVDVYRVCELYNDRTSRFATTTHVAQLKSWRLIVPKERKCLKPKLKTVEMELQTFQKILVRVPRGLSLLLFIRKVDHNENLVRLSG